MTKRARAGKRNTIKVDLASYSYYLRGVGGIGKTTLVYELGRKLWGADGMFIIQLGKEDGVRHLHDAFYDEGDTWESLVSIVEDLCKYRTTDFKDVRMVAIDSVDELFRIAEKEVVRLHNMEAPIDKRTKSVNGAFGGYGKGLDKTVDIVIDLIWKLQEAGYGLFFIGHTKVRTIKDPLTEIEYDLLTTNISTKYDNAIKDKVYITGTAYVDRSVDKTKKRVSSERRVISFRDESYAVDTKSRFTEITPVIDFSVDAFIEAVNKAIEDQIRIQSGVAPTAAQMEEMRTAEVQASLTEVPKPTKEENIKYLTEKFASFDAELRADVMGSLNAAGATKFIDASDELIESLVAKVKAKLG